MRTLLKRFFKVVGVVVLLFVIVVVMSGWRAFGRKAEGERLVRMQRSPQWRGGHFENPQPLWNDLWGSLGALFHASPDVAPKGPLTTEPVQVSTPPGSGLRVTWLGHSTSLIEIDGHRLLTDPVWSDRASPLGWLGPHRWSKPAIELGALGLIDAVVISHDHYDHLDHATIERMKDWDTTFIVPLGVGAHLAYWGVPEAHIVELDWWERTRVHGLEVVCTPARHASGRTLFDKDTKLWAGWALISDAHRVYFSGDTGLFPAMKEIGERLGPFDLTMIEIGQYNRAWPDWHGGPEQAVRAHGLVRGRAFLPIHWALFQLALHGWTEPIERALAEGARVHATLVTPRVGESIEPTRSDRPLPWWPVASWKSGAEDPIVSTSIEALR